MEDFNKWSYKMIIDTHVHIGRGGKKDAQLLDTESVLRLMDNYKIDRAVLLPRGQSPENGFFNFDTYDVLNVVKQYPNRFIPFCKLDPRNGNNSPDTDFSWVLEEFKSLGCKGMGELTANLYIDDPLYWNLFNHCANAGLPILFHLAARVGYKIYGAADDINLPRLEKTLAHFSNAIFIGHAQSFWAEISSEVDPGKRGGYPKGPIKTFGRVAELLKKYTNFYGDISAGSGYNALSRDTEMGYKFIEEFQDKLLFGTDIAHPNQELHIVGFLRNALAQGKISLTAFNKITEFNIKKILGL